MDFKESETYKNLEKAYTGELLAGTKYRIYARIANKDGFRQMGSIFEETAGNEQEHAEVWLRMLNEGALPMLDEIPRQVKRENGRKCTGISRKRRKKKALWILPGCSAGLGKWKDTTISVSGSWLRISGTERFSVKKRKRYGSA